ncbi:MAG: hypothetical protein M1836_004013 [Candelina mexicana]|nr:MAG: hypothetical protein M1836_004013 [Candelina mexicana]
MAGYTLIGSIAIALLVIAFTAAWFNGDIYPIVVYIYTYLTEGQAKAEDKALEAMGESRGSYFLKDQLKGSKEARDLVDVGQKNFKTVDDVQRGLTGGLTDDVTVGLQEGLGIRKKE